MNIPLTLLLSVLWMIVQATVALSEKDTIICFRHKETHAIVRPCQTFKSENDAYTRIYCMDVNETMQPFSPINMEDWEQLEGGICLPRKGFGDVPRGGKKSSFNFFSGCRAK